MTTFTVTEDELEQLDAELVKALVMNDHARAAEIDAARELLLPPRRPRRIRLTTGLTTVAPSAPSAPASSDGKSWRAISEGWEEISIKPLSKSNRRIRGIASSNAIDLRNSALLPRGLRAQLPVPLYAEHKVKGRPFGQVYLLRRNDEFLYFEAEILDLFGSDHAWKRMTEGEWPAVSVGWNPNSPYITVGDIEFCDDWKLRELSLTRSPANQDCRAEIITPMSIDWREYVATPPPPGSERPTNRNLPYAGTWKADQPYRAGQFVTDHGSLWACLADVEGARPGDGDPHWKLAVKRGEADRLEAKIGDIKEDSHAEL